MPSPAASPSRRGRWLALIALLVLAVNLRPTAMAPGPVLTQISDELRLSGTVAGLLTSLPALCFAAFGGLAPWLARAMGPHRSMLAALVAMVVGQTARLLAPNGAIFLSFSVLALAGMATANVLLPSLVKTHFPHRVGLVTTLYTTILSAGVAATAVSTAPLAAATGSWRTAMIPWVLLAAVALPPWLLMLRHDRRTPTGGPRPARITMGQIARTPLAWFMALFFAFQSMQAYSVFGWIATIFQHEGYSATESGLYLGLITGLGIPLNFLLSGHTARTSSPYAAIGVIAGSGFVGYLGLLLAPTAAPMVWSVLLSIGTAAFPIFITLIGLRARTAEGTATLSAFSQCLGYLMAMPGPLLIGVLYERTGEFTAPVLMMMAMIVPLTVFGLLSSRPRHIEDQLR